MSLARNLAWQNFEMVLKSSVAYQFARYALRTHYESLPPEVVHAAKRILLDTLGCAIGAHAAPGRPIIEDTIKEFGGKAEATVFGSGFRTTAMNATLVNCFMIRYLDYNDLGGGTHNSEAVAPILAVAEREGAGGRAFLTSLVLSYELGARVPESIIGPGFEPRGWHGDVRTGLSMPAPLGKLMGLNADQLANAVAIGGAHGLSLGILDGNREELAMAKNLRLGMAAQNAILSCVLAKRGFTGMIRVVEGDRGFREVILNGDMDLERLTDFSGWRILRGSFKTVCQNWTTNAQILATLAIVKENDLKPDDIEAVHIKTSARDARHVTSIPGKKYPRNTESATHSAFFGNAMAIKERALGPEQFKPEKFNDPVIRDLIERITVEVDLALGERGPGASSEVITKDGRRFFKHLDWPHGHFNDPLTDAEVEDKFRRSAELCLDADQSKALIDAVWNVDKLERMAPLVKLMVWE